MINLADTVIKIVENYIFKWKTTLKATRNLLTCKQPPTRILLVAIWISHQKVMTSSWRFTQIYLLHVHVPVHVWNRNLTNVLKVTLNPITNKQQAGNVHKGYTQLTCKTHTYRMFHNYCFNSKYSRYLDIPNSENFRNLLNSKRSSETKIHFYFLLLSPTMI